ncbi:MAG: glycoside hydrolase family 88 protein, partial [Acidobacteriota bacterium]|nr:glycoside hydrolase family 88 protein [Acidobacteriota bacterium]
QRTMAGVVRYQDPSSGLWWEVMDKGAQAGNFPEASASCMFVYALQKGVRRGYLPVTDAAAARRGWDGVLQRFVRTEPDGMVSLTGIIRGAGLGGTPYRSGTYAYYIGERVGANDGKGLGAFLMAAGEMEYAPTATQARGKTVLLDAWFNAQTRTNAAGVTELFHYKWDDDSDPGFSFFGRAFANYGARLAELTTAPTAAALAGAQVYLIVSPDNASKNPHPHAMDAKSAAAIAAWVRRGGVLLLLSNDAANTEFEHFNLLADRFGMHFNPVLRNHVVGDDYAAGTVEIPAGTGVFATAHHAYMKDTCTITVSGHAKALVTATSEPRSDVMLAVAKLGKGTVLGVVDPWVYNEYVDHRNHLPTAYDQWQAAQDLAAWALRQAADR